MEPQRTTGIDEAGQQIVHPPDSFSIGVLERAAARSYVTCTDRRLLAQSTLVLTPRLGASRRPWLSAELRRMIGVVPTAARSE